MRTREEINQEISVLRNQLRESKPAENIKNIIAQIKVLEAEQAQNNKIDLLRKVNREQNNLRELAKIAFNCEQVKEDIVISGGYFHKTKVKKYPVLASLGNNVRAKFENGTITQLTINGHTFYMVKSKYEYGKETTHTRYATFEELLKANSILLEDLTLEKFNELTEKIEAANSELKEALNKYSKQCDDLEMHLFNHIGLSSQRPEHLYVKSFNA